MPTPPPKTGPARSGPGAARTLVTGADPDPVTRALIGLYLEPHGYDVRVAASVEAALATLDGAEPGAIVCSERALDEAPEAARAALRERSADVPLVVLLEPGAAPAVTRDWPGTRERLTKPLRADALLSVLHGTRPAAAQPPVCEAGAGGAGAAHPRPAPVGAAEGDALGGFQALIAEMEMEPAMVRELASSFLERAPVYLHDIAADLAEGRLERVDRAAHTMKGMCGNLRFERLVQLSDALRKAVQAGEVATAERHLGALHAELEQVSAALRARWPQVEQP